MSALRVLIGLHLLNFTASGAQALEVGDMAAKLAELGIDKI